MWKSMFIVYIRRKIVVNNIVYKKIFYPHYSILSVDSLVINTILTSFKQIVVDI